MRPGEFPRLRRDICQPPGYRNACGHYPQAFLTIDLTLFLLVGEPFFLVFSLSFPCLSLAFLPLPLSAFARGHITYPWKIGSLELLNSSKHIICLEPLIVKAIQPPPSVL
jgi:hypothetical protein